MNYLSQILSFLNETDPVSSMRVVFVGLSYILGITWSVCAFIIVYRTNNIPDIPSNCLILLSTLWGMKVGQKIFGEK